MQKGLSRIKKGDIPEAILLEAVHTLTNKLIHEPSFKLKNASSQNRNDLFNNYKNRLNHELKIITQMLLWMMVLVNL